MNNTLVTNKSDDNPSVINESTLILIVINTVLTAFNTFYSPIATFIKNIRHCKIGNAELDTQPALSPLETTRKLEEAIVEK
jgi:hypothetical protein